MRIVSAIPVSLCAMLAWSSVAIASEVAPRERAAAVAQRIEAHYFDAPRGATIARDLRAQAGAGAFDAFRDPSALAAELTRRLKPLDRHFKVLSPDAAPASRGAAPRARRPPGAEHGLRKAEMLPGGIGLLSLDGFAHFAFDDPDAPARHAIDGALARLVAARALVVDLRGNRGGSPHMVGYLASAFVAPGADVYNRFRTRARTFDEAPAAGYPAPRPRLPLYVLIDGGTGSAAESFAYTLQAAGRATIVGERSAGAANPGELFDAGDGWRVFVSTGSPVNPVTQGNWEGTGVVPDLATPSAAALEAALARAKDAHG